MINESTKNNDESEMGIEVTTINNPEKLSPEKGVTVKDVAGKVLV